MRNLPLHDQGDADTVADAERGFVAALTPGVVTTADGRVIWDADSYAFLRQECPPTAHPGLWRHARLCSRQGLYEVTEGVYQVRGLDLANMTLVEGDEGVVVIDPLGSTECARAALGLYRAHRGPRPVTGVVHTHSHVDHFGGVRGVTGGGVPIVAPAGFLEHVIAEHVHAGPATARRSVYANGTALDRDPSGQIGTGLGLALSTGTVSLIPPTVAVDRTGQEETIDGVRIVFQLTPGTAAPTGMNLHLPGRSALFLADNATRALHDVLGPRGAPVGDARAWSRHLDEAAALFAGRSDVALASHHWPTWGRDRIVALLSAHRDLYAYLHDQTLRLMNSGLTGTEIAEALPLPPELERAACTRGLHGTAVHTVKAVYQRYLGWYDGNPAHLWEHPPRESATRYVECLGGGAAVVAHARRYAEAGDLRFAAQLLNQAVFADEGNKEARDLLAEVYTRLGHAVESGAWRDCYLTGAKELVEGIAPAAPYAVPTEVLAAMSVEQVFDLIASRVNGPRAWRERLSVDWYLPDLGERHRTTLSNGALIHQATPPDEPADLTLKLTKAQLVGLLAGRNVEGVEREGDTTALKRLVAVLDPPLNGFAVVTP
ncbi:alkyl/aryl-sulfatase [Nonomuraea pusilla]|uniref:Alkyl sulfatase BDS1, metallo-beta-lactamase superfamily n=1 Tax=Nonomuraea pusilla TaxID=46177 RepID=A0A1H7ZS51_9ACTN|nr:alkyl sulfatase dimerization domain-containing protein [Nonomuraea pusilla]SEM60339.1 Alkyl sulfatase BDS1, metallo-beta-lactamase superfamily [Nonomuraea pusilla]